MSSRLERFFILNIYTENDCCVVFFSKTAFKVKKGIRRNYVGETRSISSLLKCLFTEYL